MSIRRHCRAPLVALVAAMYLVSSMGCAAGRLRTTAQPPAAKQQPSPLAQASLHATPQRLPGVRSGAEVRSDVELASYSAAEPSWDSPIISPNGYAAADVDLSNVVRGQGYDNGPIKEFLWSPYVVGLLVVAGVIVVPLAIEGGQDDEAAAGTLPAGP